MHNQFIQLNRHFSVFSQDEEFGDDYEMRVAFGHTGQLAWDDVLEKHRVVILAAPGAGKTEEIKQATHRLRSDGKAAFFLRLEQIPEGLELAFDIGEYSEFQEWLAGEGEAWFFLDSVDEARLSNPKYFETAIRKFSLALAGHGQRSWIFITSRIVEWRGRSDVLLMKEKLPFHKLEMAENEMDLYLDLGLDEDDDDTKTASSAVGAIVGKSKTDDLELNILGLQSLTKGQMQQFAYAHGLSDAEEFVKEIIRNDAKMFASRPLDLEELIQASVIRKLRERDTDRDNPLTVDKARQGAELLAAAATLQHTSRICVPDEDGIVEGIQAAELLSDWSEREVRALLGRPIFDKAIYGTVRFHHRVMREYLCAQWLNNLLQDGKSRLAIEGLFFRKQYGLEVVAPTMKSILPWIALEDERILAHTLIVAPELLIDGGDPSELPTEIRKLILEGYCEQYSHRTRGYGYFDDPSIKRFAHPDLTSTVNDLLDRFGDHKEIGHLLLTMVWQGKMTGCWERARTLVLDVEKNGMIRRAALEAIEMIGSEDQINSVLQELLPTLTADDHYLVAKLIEYFAPRYLSTDAVIALLERLTPPARFEHWPLDAVLENYIGRCHIDTLYSLMHGFFQQLKKPPFVEQRYCEVSEANIWLLKYGAQASERLIIERHPNALAEEVLAVVSMNATAPHYDAYRHDENRLKELVPDWSVLNDKLFWYDVAQTRLALDKKKNERLTDWWRVRLFRDYWRFQPADFDRISDDIKRHSLMDDRLVALSLAFHLYVDGERPRSWRIKLKKIVAGQKELEVALHTCFHPPAQSMDKKKRKRIEVNRERRRKRHKEKKEQELGKEKKWLNGNIERIGDVSVADSGNVWNINAHLMSRLRELGTERDQWARGNWRDLIPVYGSEVAGAFRDGSMAYWRVYKPPLRSEGIESITGAIVLGLTGLAIEASEVSKWVDQLSSEEASLASRYALWEMNGFPHWLPELHNKFPDIVRSTLVREIQWEILEADESHDGYYVTADIAPYGEWIKEEIAPAILEALAISSPRNEQLFNYCLQIILTSCSVTDAQIQPVAQNGSLDANHPERQPVWFATWVCLEAEPALKALENHLSSITEPTGATDFAMKFAVALLGERRHGVVNDRHVYRTVPILHNLYNLLHMYIRREEDINRVSGGYSPQLRDDAQDARDRIFSLLREIPGKNTYLTLTKISRKETQEHIQQWIDYHAKNRAEADADIEPWNSLDLRRFSDEQEWKPRDHRQLFALVVDRLLEFKDGLENGDSSNAGLLMKSDDETEYRNYIAGWVINHAQDT